MVIQKRRLIIKLKNVKNGDDVCIFSLSKDLYIINLFLLEDNKFDINVQLDCPDEILLDIHKDISTTFKKKILSLKEPLQKCEYVLGYYKGIYYLLFYLHEGVPMTYTLTKKCAKLLNVFYLTPVWEGELTFTTPYAFTGDIIIQKK